MVSGFRIRKNQYYDSVFLMGINQRLSKVEGVNESAVLMGTENNKALLVDIGIKEAEIDNAKANDLIVAVIADNPEIVSHLFENLDSYFEGTPTVRSEVRLRSFEDGLKAKPAANLAVISVPGQYAAREARKALESGLHVFIFSDNVPIEEELSLKKLGFEKDLLVMGPDCGTSIINGTCIGFANKVRSGNIGVVGASGTGLQEFTSQVNNAGSGISHAIGTGSHDLTDAIGGLTTITALNALEADPNTQVIAIVSKPPGESSLEKVNAYAKELDKPVIGCFLGIDEGLQAEYENLILAYTVDEAVSLAFSKLNKKDVSLGSELSDAEIDVAAKQRKKYSENQKFVRGIFAGGTFCYQSQQIFKNAGMEVYSNGPINKHMLLANPDDSKEHTFVDMGDDHYTVGTPHPMIDGKYRRERIIRESKDPQVAIVLLDFILGYNASMDPAGDLIESIIEAKKIAQKRDDELCFVASICGTEEDPQELAQQANLLSNAGVFVFYSNAKATLFCTEIMNKK